MGRFRALWPVLGAVAFLQVGGFAQTLSIVSGDNQSIGIGQTDSTPLTVNICQPGEVACGGRTSTTIQFQIASDQWATICNSTFSSCNNPFSVTIPVAGSQASAYLWPGQVVGSYTVTATDVANNSAVTFHVTNVSGQPASLKACCGQSFQATEGQQFPAINFTVLDQYGNAASGSIAVTLQAPSTEPSGNFAGSRTATIQAANGSGTVPAFTADNTAGSYKLHASPSCSGCALDFTMTNVAPTGTPTPTQTSLTSSMDPSIAGQPVNFTATVTSNSGTPTGTVAFLDGSTTIVSGVALSTGMATYQDASLSAGTHSITAVYSGDSNNSTSTSSKLTQEVFNSAAPTTTTVVSSANPSVPGQSVTFTATVTTSGGWVPGNDAFLTFWDGSNELGSTVVNSGKGSLSVSSLSAGAHSITAVYGGDLVFAASTSAVFTQTVNSASLKSTQASLSSSLNPSIVGQPVNLTATVTSNSGTPTGTVTFKDGSSTIVSVALNGGVATYQHPALTAGAHSLTAVYSGDSNYSGSTSATLTETVYNSPAATMTKLASSANPSSPGQSVTFTATVTTSGPGTPTGIVTWWDGTTELGSFALSGTSASLTASTLSLGAHSITANYGGDVVFAASTSAALTQTVSNTIATTTALVSSLNPSAVGQSVNFTATVTPNGSGTPTGSVTFKDGTATLGSSNLSSGKAVYSTSSLSAGTHSITAVYGGDSNFSRSTSAALSQKVNAPGYSTSTSLSGSPDPAASGQAVTFTATVTSSGSGTPTGAVTFEDGSTILSSVALSGNQASYATSSLAVGAHSITASYGGDANFSSSTSAVLTETVTGGTAGISVSPSGLSFTAYQGRSNPPSQSLQVSSSGAVSFSVTNIPAWLTVTPTNGNTPAVVSVAVNANLLATGATSGTISIAPANGQAAAVTVQAAVNPFSIGASSPVNVSLAAGTITSGTLAVTTVDNGPASVQAAATTSGNWLTLASATLSAPGPLNYTLDATALAAGNYAGTIALSCASANPCAPVPVAVNLTVTQNTTVTISQVLNATGEAPLISQNTWIEIKGTNLSQTKRIWQASDFDPTTGLMPTELDGVSATVDGKPAYVYYISPTQVNVLTPLDTALGPVTVQVKNGVGTSAPATVTMLANSLGFFAFNSGQYAAATHAKGALLGPTTLYPGLSTPAAPGETIVLYGNGFGEVSPAINPGAAAQVGVLPYNPTISIGGLPATVLYAAAVTPGLYQFNVVVPPNAQNGDLTLLATYNGVSTQQGVVITVSH